MILIQYLIKFKLTVGRVQKKILGARDVAHTLRALAAHPEYWGSIPSTRMALTSTSNSNARGSNALFSSL